MPDLVCPECGTVTTLPAIRRASDEFCSHCDFPLFWAPSAVPEATATASSDTTLRRLPGAGGRLIVGSRVCPTCGELNLLSAVLCVRCNGEMDPAPVVAPPPPPLPAPLPPPAPVVKRRWWPWVVLAVVVVAGIVTAVVLAN